MPLKNTREVPLGPDQALPGRGAGQDRPGGDRAVPEDAAGLARRLPHARCGRHRHLRRQGAQPEGARDQLRACRQPHQPHHAHDLRHGVDGVRDGAHGGRGAAAGSQPDQALPPALQRAAARRQVLPLHPDRPRPRGAADPQAPRRAQPQGRLLRAVRIGRSRQPHHQHAGAGVPAALLLGPGVREPHAPLPAAPDQALLGALHRRDRPGGLRRPGRGGDPLPQGREPECAPDVPAPHAGSRRQPGLRAGRQVPQPPVGAGARHRRPEHQPRRHRGGRRVRRLPGGRADLRAGVLLPRRPELGQPRLLPARRQVAGTRGGAGELHRPVLRRQAGAALHLPQPRTADAGPARGGALHQGRAQGRSARAAAGHQDNHRRARHAERARSHGAPAGRDLLAAHPAREPEGAVRAGEGAAPHRGVRQQPHPGGQRRRRHDRGRARGVREEPVPQVQHQVGRPRPRRRLRHDARGAGAALQAPGAGRGRGAEGGGVRPSGSDTLARPVRHGVRPRGSDTFQTRRV